jgi:hypothetical protein
MSENQHNTTAAPVAHGRSLDRLYRLVRRWEGAAKRYNYDCNTRQAKPGDAARNRLRIAAEMAFERMMAKLKAVIAANDEAHLRVGERKP